MPWIIDTDFISEPGKNAVGVMGPTGYQGDGSELVYKFRLKDDDGEVYYLGRSHSSSSFAPLDDFGLAGAGCTAIEYWDEARQVWEPL